MVVLPSSTTGAILSGTEATSIALLARTTKSNVCPASAGVLRTGGGGDVRIGGCMRMGIVHLTLKGSEMMFAMIHAGYMNALNSRASADLMLNVGWWQNGNLTFFLTAS